MKRVAILYYFLIGGFLLLLSLPVLNKMFCFFEPEELEGDFYLKEKPQISLESWMDYSFQPRYGSWLEENIGFRQSLVRIKNQLEFSVYNKPNASGVFVGKEGVLYQEGYYRAYLGKDGVGEEEVLEKTKMTLLIQNKLKEKGIPFLYVMAPGKVTVYPEYLPESRRNTVPGVTNNQMYVDCFKKERVNFIDFLPLFKQWKKSASFPLFPKGGIHWSANSVASVADTIFSRLDALSKFSFPKVVVSEGEVTDREFVFTDNDLERLMNLLWPMKSWELHYPNVRFENKTGKQKPKILIIGDSFAQSFFGFGPYNSSVFSHESRYWQGYNFGFWKLDSTDYYYKIDKTNLVETVESFDMVMVLTTEINMNNLGLGFIDELYTSYVHPPKGTVSKTKILGYDDFEKETHIDHELLPIDKQSIRNGKYGNWVTKQRVYSKGYGINKEELSVLGDEVSLCVSLDYFIDSVTNNFENDIQLVLEVNNELTGENETFVGYDLRVPTLRAKSWNKKAVVFKSRVPSEDFSMKVYVFNNGEIPIMIDNFEVAEMEMIYSIPSDVPFSSYSIIGRLDFEKSTDKDRISLLTNQQSLGNGLYGNEVTPEKIYSKGFSIQKSDLQIADNTVDLCISLEYFLEKIPSGFAKEIKLAVEINTIDNPTNVIYKTYDLTIPSIAEKQWNKKTVLFRSKIPSEDFGIKIYVFNHGKTPIVIDNFEVANFNL